MSHLTASAEHQQKCSAMTAPPFPLTVHALAGQGLQCCWLQLRGTLAPRPCPLHHCAWGTDVRGPSVLKLLLEPAWDALTHRLCVLATGHFCAPSQSPGVPSVLQDTQATALKPP